MGEMHKRRWMQTLHRAPLFFCSCLPISSIRTGGITGGGWWWYDVLYFGGVVLSPFQLVGTMLSHGAPGNLGEKFHPARPEASNPYGAGNFSPVHNLVADFPVIASPSGYRFTEWAAYIVERSYLTAASSNRMKCSKSFHPFFPLFF